MKLRCLDYPLRLFFQWHARKLCRWPVLYLIFPFLVATCCVAGVHLKPSLDTYDADYLYIPIGAPSLRERNLMLKHWPANQDKFIPELFVGAIEATPVIVFMTAVDGSNLLETENVKKIVHLNKVLMNETYARLDGNGRKYHYKDLCSKWLRKCSEINQQVDLINYYVTNNDTDGKDVIDFPYFIPPKTTRRIHIGDFFHGVSTNRTTNDLAKVELIMMRYFLRMDTPKMEKLKEKFEEQIGKNLEKLSREYAKSNIDVTYISPYALSQALRSNEDLILERMLILFAVLSIVSDILSLKFGINEAGKIVFMADHSHPVLAMAGFLTALMGVGSAFGLMLMFGVKYTFVLGAVPFLIISVCIDDTFIMIAALNNNFRERPEKRIELMFEEAGMSITMTTFTSAASFMIGLSSPIQIMKIFAAYLSTGMILTFFYQITFFASLTYLIEKKGGVWKICERLGLCCCCKRKRRKLFPSSIHVPAITYQNGAAYAKDNPTKTAVPTLVHQNGTNGHLPTNERNGTGPHAPTTKMPETLIQNGVKDETKLSLPINRASITNGEVNGTVTKSTTNGLHGVTTMNGTIISKGLDHHEKPNQYKKVALRKISSLGMYSNGREVPNEIIGHFLSEYYGRRFLAKPWAQIAITVVYIAYIVLAIWGATGAQQNFEIQATIQKGNQIKRLFDYKYKYDVPIAIYEVLVAVLNPPNMTIPANRHAVKQMYRSFTSMECVGNRNSFWLENFENYIGPYSRDMNRPITWSYNLLEWSSHKTTRRDHSQDFSWRTPSAEEKRVCYCTRVLKAFRFRVSLKRHRTAKQKIECNKNFRSLAKQYSAFNVITFSMYWPKNDVEMAIQPGTMSSILGALLAVILVSITLMPNIIGIFWIIVTLVSVCTGLVGYMTFWGVSINLVSMVVVSLSFGLSIDYSAHFIYCFLNENNSAEQKLMKALRCVSLPIIQGCVSTIAGVLTLLGLDMLETITLFRTILLVAVLGLLHSCVFLPVWLMWSTYLGSWITSKIQNLKKSAITKDSSEKK